ncbi:FAD-binding protein [Actinophytocola sp.]|uniref:FAD-binding protein n=1 Tax=Actinophytocola sp. TaxID=1872138 RepID=UPI003D6BC925
MDANRRAVLIAGLAATAAAAGATVAATKGASAAQTKDVPPPPLDGELKFDRATRDAAGEDFGHLIRRTPEAVLVPGSDDDVAATIKWAAQRHRKFAPQGQSHSVFGRSEAEDGVVGDITALSSVGNVQNDRIVVGGGAKWSEILAVTLAAGKTPPVLLDYIELSVGGTIVVGGVGGTTSEYGVVADNVIEMKVVTGEGQKLTCSASQNSDLFDAVRAGLGQVGVITEATLKLVAAPESVRRYLLVYPDLATMVADARLLSTSEDDRFDAVQGAVIPSPSGGFVFRLDLAKYFTGTAPDDGALLAGLSDNPDARQISTLAYFDYVNRLAALENLLRSNGQWFFPHPWITTFVGDSDVQSVVSGELDRLNPPVDLGQFGQVVLSPIKRGAIESPLLRMPSDSLCYAFNYVRVPTTDDTSNASRLVEANKAMYQRVKNAGGTLYPVSAFPLNKNEWRQHFGSAFGRLDDAKRKFDPGHVLTPGYEIF